MSSLYNALLIDQNFSIKYILGLINSSLFQYLMNKLTFEKTKGAFTKAKIFHYYKLPIKVTNNQQPIIDLVNQISSLKRDDINADISKQEQNIDILIYKLYDLTYDEIKIVDPETIITEEEYRNNK